MVKMAWFWLKIRKKMPSQTKSPNESRVLSPFFLLYFYFFIFFLFGGVDGQFG